jgi:hypothetical protein
MTSSSGRSAVARNGNAVRTHGSVGGSKRRYSFLREELPSDASSQAQYLKQLNHSGQHDAVIALFESGRLSNAEAMLGEYVTALARVDRLNNTALLQTLQVG